MTKDTDNQLPVKVYMELLIFMCHQLLLIESVGEEQTFASPFDCCIQEVLLCCHPVLSEESIAAQLSLVQSLETTIHILSTAIDGTGRHSGFKHFRQ